LDGVIEVGRIDSGYAKWQNNLHKWENFSPFVLSGFGAILG
jgi:hypothetical protein